MTEDLKLFCDDPQHFNPWRRHRLRIAAHEMLDLLRARNAEPEVIAEVQRVFEEVGVMGLDG